VNPSPSALSAILEKFAAEAEHVFEQARVQARREFAAELNLAVRRIRQAATREELGETVADTATPFAAGAAWFRIEAEGARSESLELTIPLAGAAAFREALETREPVVALAEASEVSAELVERFAHAAESRAFVYPIVDAEAVPALLYAWADSPGQAQNSALELLAQVAAAAWRTLLPPPSAAPPLVNIAAAEKPANPWEALSAQDQQTHLRAQRYARVQVAEMRLRHAAAIHTGRVRRSLYQSLRDPIDAARAAFRKEFFAKCPTMVDYLHLELTRTLANDDADLLGKDYPGPMV
jgi:hypothetical protein